MAANAPRMTKTMKVQRYDLISVTSCDWPWQKLQLEPEGEWMRFEDHEARVRRLREALRDLLTVFDDHTCNKSCNAKNCTLYAARAVLKETE